MDIGATLFGAGRRKVLGVLFTRADQPMYLREIIAAAGSGQGQVQRELENLHRAGLVLREKRANHVYYRPNPDAPIYEELKAIAFKTFGVADVLKEMLAPLAPRIEVAFIYGSLARQEDTGKSDIDVMVVGNVGFGEARSCPLGGRGTPAEGSQPGRLLEAGAAAKLREKGGFLHRSLAESSIHDATGRSIFT